VSSVSEVVRILASALHHEEEPDMTTPTNERTTSSRCAQCARPATTVAEVRIGPRRLEIPVCGIHRRELIRGARRLRE
jgi:hypothetical protein